MKLKIWKEQLCECESASHIEWLFQAPNPWASLQVFIQIWSKLKNIVYSKDSCRPTFVNSQSTCGTLILDVIH